MTARILIIEDSPLNLELATDVLEAAGYTVLAAASAEDGLRLARAERPDLVLMDLRLPGMDGLSAVRALRADPATAGIRAAALTAQVMRGDEEAARAAGFDGYLAKPIDTRTFAAQVAALLGPGGAP